MGEADLDSVYETIPRPLEYRQEIMVRRAGISAPLKVGWEGVGCVGRYPLEDEAVQRRHDGPFHGGQGEMRAL